MVGFPRPPHFADILETIKKRPSMRLLLDGPAGFDRLNALEQYEHRTKCMLWDFLRRTRPQEYQRHARECGTRNAEQLKSLLRIHDPLFETTWSMLRHMLEMLPDTAEYLVKKGTHDNPTRFLELYEEMREWAEEVESRKRRRARVEPVQGRQRDVDEDRSLRRRMEKDALVEKIKSGRAEEGDLLTYMELAMPDEHTENIREGGRS